jgi:hypothetical protein
VARPALASASKSVARVLKPTVIDVSVIGRIARGKPVICMLGTLALVIALAMARFSGRPLCRAARMQAHAARPGRHCGGVEAACRF